MYTKAMYVKCMYALFIYIKSFYVKSMYAKCMYTVSMYTVSMYTKAMYTTFMNLVMSNLMHKEERKAPPQAASESDDLCACIDYTFIHFARSYSTLRSLNYYLLRLALLLILVNDTCYTCYTW